MILRSVVSLCALLLVVSLALASCAGVPRAVEETEPLYGTWLNIYYVPAAWPQLIHHPNG